MQTNVDCFILGNTINKKYNSITVVVDRLLDIISISCSLQNVALFMAYQAYLT